jgi:hypothetical protein
VNFLIYLTANEPGESMFLDAAAEILLLEVVLTLTQNNINVRRGCLQDVSRLLLLKMQGNILFTFFGVDLAFCFLKYTC